MSYPLLIFLSIISCILDKCTFITHVTMLLLCVKTKTLAAQLAPAANKQCKIVGAGAEALLYFSTFWFFTPHFHHQPYPLNSNESPAGVIDVP